MRQEGMTTDKKVKKKYQPKLYEAMDYPGQRILRDAKVVPRHCIANLQLHLYQYTAIDEFYHFHILGADPEQSTVSSAAFLKKGRGCLYP